MRKNSGVKSVYENFYILTSLDYKYYNIVSTEDEIILDFTNRSFKPWIIRSGQYIVNDYNNISVEDIKKRSKENIIIKRDEIDKIEFSKRTLFKNAFIKIDFKNEDKTITLITKDKLKSKINI